MAALRHNPCRCRPERRKIQQDAGARAKPTGKAHAMLDAGSSGDDSEGRCVSGQGSPRAIELEKDIPFAPNTDVVAVGFCFKGCKLMATKGVLVDKPSRLDCKELGTSTCKITKAGIGGPLIDTRGNIVGMNFIDDKETPYLPRKKIHELLRHFDANGHNSAETIDKGDLYRWPVPEPYWDFPPHLKKSW